MEVGVVSDWPEDDGDAWAHQMQLEQRQREEEAMAKGRQLLADFRRETKEFEREMTESKQRINTNWSELYGDHGF